MNFDIGNIVIYGNVNKQIFMFEIDNILIIDGVELLYGRSTDIGTAVYAVKSSECRLVEDKINFSDEQINRVMELLKTKAEIKKAHMVVKSELKKYNGQIKLIAKNKLNGDK